MCCGIALLVYFIGFVTMQTTCKWIGTAPFCHGHTSDCEKEDNFKHYWFKSTCGSGSECWSGSKVLCCNLPNPYTLYWKGCGSSCSDCDSGDHCVGSDRCGGGGKCSSGRKYICGIPPSVSAVEESDPGLVLASVNYDKIILEN